MKLSEFMRRLDETVIGQLHAKKQFVTAIYQAQNLKMLISGPSGCGKTFLVDTYCKIKGLVCCHIDASKLTQTGFAGNKVEGYIADFVYANGGNLTAVENGVIFIDEFDKLRTADNKSANSDIANIGVQYELLKFFDGDEIIIDYNHRKLAVRTQNMKIICAGAFSYTKLKILKKEDLVACGFIDELAGRICAYVPMDALTKDDFFCLIKNKKCFMLEKFRGIYEELNETIVFSEEEIYEIAEECASSPFGVRALEGIIYERFRDELFEMLMKHDIDV